jgi:hypothetical protein
MIARDHQRACHFGYRVAANTNALLDLTITQTCGKSLRAWKRWGASDIDLGTYRKTPPGGTKHSVACDTTSCQGHPDGAPFDGGYQRKDTGAMVCLVGCGSRSPPLHATVRHFIPVQVLALVRTAGYEGQRSCHVGSLSWAGGPVGGPYTRYSTVLNTEDSPSGCEQVLTRVLSTGGHTTRSGLIRHVGTATAYVKDGTTVAKAWTEKQPNGKPQDRVCKQDYPTDEVNFHSCTG